MPLAKSFCSEAQGSAFSYTSIYFMTSLQRRLSFSHKQLGGFQLATIHRESREVTTANEYFSSAFTDRTSGNIFTPMQQHRLGLPEDSH